MRRREFISLLGGAVAVSPLAARAQQPATPTIGFLRSSSLADATVLVNAFRQGLKEAGYVEGQNVLVEYRAAENQQERLKALVADFIRKPVDVIVGNVTAALAAKTATTAIPIVFATGGDPVQEGLVGSLNRPGGNTTGISFFATQLGGKRLALLRELVPSATTIAILSRRNYPTGERELKAVQAEAQTVGQQLFAVDVDSDREIEPAFLKIVQSGSRALLVLGESLMFSNRERLVALAARHGLPASYDQREYVTAGGLMSYGTSLTDAYRQVGTYAGRILKGEKPADLSVSRSVKFEMSINLKAAKELGLTVPPLLLGQADELIE